MLMVAVLNNLDTLIVGGVFAGVMFWSGRRYERWVHTRRARRATSI